LKTADGGQPPYYRAAEPWFDSVETPPLRPLERRPAWLAYFRTFATGGVPLPVTETE
jgi:hypothetical protein